MDRKINISFTDGDDFKIYMKMKEFIALGYNEDNEDYNTRSFFDCITPDCITPEGNKIEINRYFADGENGMEEISHDEYTERLKHKK